ncbi:MAG: ABC transporter substrate-binding protein [Deltaproteobacteria bacterium]|nr:ABC transporter substrate-binding protein [Deltaproteobacteria bacterium]
MSNTKKKRENQASFKRNFIKGIVLMFAVVAVISIVFPNVLRAEAPPDILIGHIHPLSGALAYLGNQLKNGTEMAVNEINEAGGIKSLGGAKLKLIDADSEGKPDLSISAVERLDSAGVVAITGCLQSAVTIVATQIAERHRVPFLVSVAVDDAITERGFKYTFRVQPRAAQMAPQTVELLSNMAKQVGEEVKTIAYIHDNTSFGGSLSGLVVEAAPKYGMKVVSLVPYSPKSADVSTEVRKVKAAGADIVMASGYFDDGVRVFRAMKGMRVNPKAFLGCGNGAYSDQNFVKELGDMTKYVMDGNYQANPTSPLAKKMFDRYNALYGHKMPPSAIFAYQPIYVLADALERAKSTDREDIREALVNTNLKEHVLPQGPIVFDATGQNKNAKIALTQVLGGRIKVVWPEEFAEAKLVFPVPR